jgi:Beta-galactosidase
MTLNKVLVSFIGALALALLELALAPNAHASTSASGPVWATLGSQPNDATTENKAGVKMAMFDFNWSSFEPAEGQFSASYVSWMRGELASFRAAGQKVTLGLGTQDTPAWVFSLANSTYVDQLGDVSTEADWVYSAAVRAAALVYFQQIAADFPLSDFWAIRLTSGGDREMLYPGGGTYWAFNPSALAGPGLPAGMTKNPDPTWKPGNSGLSAAQLTTWVKWYVGGLDNVTNWQMTTLSNLGFTGYYETVTPGDGTRPDGLALTEKANLSNDGTTGVGAVWNLYYAQLPDKANVIAYVSSVADQSGGNDSCQTSDDTLPLTSTAMDPWSATRWISRIAAANGLLIGGENPGYGLSSSLNSFYTDTSSAGMMASAIRQADTCGFKVFYWADDIYLWDGTLPFANYAADVASGI